MSNSSLDRPRGMDTEVREYEPELGKGLTFMTVDGREGEVRVMNPHANFTLNVNDYGVEITILSDFLNDETVSIRVGQDAMQVPSEQKTFFYPKGTGEIEIINLGNHHLILKVGEIERQEVEDDESEEIDTSDLKQALLGVSTQK